MTPQLYMIATPLGNLEDLTLRAQRLFQELQYFFAEDSREFKKLLNHLNIALQDKHIFSYASHNMKDATADALRFLNEGKSVGFVSDRGTPGISDPGALLVKEAIKNGIRVVPVPGASAVPTLMCASGLLETSFIFQGFLPNTLKARNEIYGLTKSSQIPLCFFESPHRIRETVNELKEKFPTGKIFVGRELTKMFETLTWHDLKDLDPQILPEKGEYACVLVPGEQGTLQEAWLSAVELRSLSEKEWSKKIAHQFSIAASDVYNALQQMKQK